MSQNEKEFFALARDLFGDSVDVEKIALVDDYLRIACGLAVNALGGTHEQLATVLMVAAASFCCAIGADKEKTIQLFELALDSGRDAVILEGGEN